MTGGPAVAQTPRAPAICVCVCTFRRPEFLGRLLREIAKQHTEDAFSHSVVVVDNDREESARETVLAFARESAVPVRYCTQPVQNIALARNEAIRQANGDFVALIDDDEFPEERWLLTLLRALDASSADGVLAPVLPHFETAPPDWIVKGGFFDRPAQRTGEVLDWTRTRTGNAMLRRALFADGAEPFDPRFGSGGEDRDFFRRKIEEGRVFIWCNEAPVFETVPPARWKRATLLRRALLRGKMAFEGARSKPVSVAKSMLAVLLYTAGLPLFLVCGQHIFMKYLIKDCDHLGKLLACAGIDLVREKYVEG